MSDEQQHQSAFMATITLMDPHDCWIMDSGASQHMTTNQNFFSTYTSFDSPHN